MANIGDLLLDPSTLQAPPIGNIPAPAQPNLEENKNLWRKFLAQTQDPNFRQALLATGTGLMRSTQPGQSGWDVAANALQGGVQRLTGLREAERARNQATVERDRQAGVQKQQLQLQGQQVDISQRNATTQKKNIEQQGAASQQAAQHAQDALDEAIRHNKSAEEIDRLRAKADQTRANAYAGTGPGGKQLPADIQKINALAAQFEAEGADPVAARARAVMLLETQARTKSPGDQARQFFSARMTAWQSDLNNLGKSMTPEMQRQMLNESIDDATRLAKLDEAGKAGPVAPTDRGGPIDRTTPAPQGKRDPAIEGKITTARSKGASPEAIKAALKKDGVDPALYGY